MIPPVWKSWIFVGLTTLAVLAIGWFWQGRDGLLWAVPVALSINYFLLIHSRFRVVEGSEERHLEGNDGWHVSKALKSLCAKAEVPVPKVVVLETDTPQIYLIGRSLSFSTLYVTQGFLDRLTPKEREGILALAVAALKTRLQFNFLILGAFFNLIFSIFSYADNMITWVIGTKRKWAQSITLRLAWPFLFLVQRWCLSQEDYFRLDAVAATLCSDRDALCQALWKLECGSLTQPLNAHPAWTHVFAVGPWDPRGPFGYLQPQPSAKSRIVQLNGGFPL